MKNSQTKPKKWMYVVWAFIIFAVAMLLIPKPKPVSHVEPRTYKQWMGASPQTLISIAAARYTDGNENLSPDDYNLLLENNMKELNTRAAEIVTCGRSMPKLDIGKNADYFETVIDFCIDKLAI